MRCPLRTRQQQVGIQRPLYARLLRKRCTEMGKLWVVLSARVQAHTVSLGLSFSELEPLTLRPLFAVGPFCTVGFSAAPCPPRADARSSPCPMS